MAIERELAREFTGMVAGSLAVEPDYRGGTATCRDCGTGEVADAAGPDTDGGVDGATLASGDRITATVCNYENHTWELQGLYCPDHAVEAVPETMGVTAMDQAVIAATLEGTGYLDPTGEFYPNALTLGAVEVLDYSPAAEGYR